MIGVSATFLAMDGSGKAALDPPRKIFGAFKGGAVQFGQPMPDKWLVIGEGIETTLAVMQSCELPGWAALSAEGIKSIVLPPEARMVLIAADNDANGTGQNAAKEAAARLFKVGHRVRIAVPPESGTDWNDVLRGKSAAGIEDASHAA